ncbi:MAG TPA: hypothetical protein VF745_09115 [Steroidobacteraceae bacterium]
MLPQALLVAHIAIVGYWLGSELVINSSYRYVCFGARLPFAERNRMMEHVMGADQHVRYALALQVATGFALAALYGFVPGSSHAAWAALGFGALWLAFIEIVHRLRHGPMGHRLAVIDRGSRYLLMAVLVCIAIGLIGRGWAVPGWLRVKLALFAGVMACGVGIRIALIMHFRVWKGMAQNGPDESSNALIRSIYIKATSILGLLWALIACIVVISVWKPA